MASSFVFSGGVVAMLYLFLLRSKKGNTNSSDTILGGWLALIAMQLAYYYVTLEGYMLPKQLSFLGFSLFLLSSPVLFLYIKQITQGATAFRLSKNWMHVLPFVFHYLTLNVLYFSGYQVSIKAGIIWLNELPELFKYLFWSVWGLVPLLYLLRALYFVNLYSKQLKQKYSFTEQINLTWVRWCVFIFGALFIAIFFSVKLIAFIKMDAHDLVMLIGCFLTLFCIVIGYFGFKHATNIVAIPVLEHTPVKSYVKSGLTADDTKRAYEKLVAFMEQEKPYLDENLNLNLLAAKLHMTANQLSQVINQQTSYNFFSFINYYRVEETKIKLVDDAYKHYAILAIAFECGFKSKSSFNKIFKDFTGVTPSQYQKNHQV